MKEDYLWDKTGAVDPEIERLENTLAVFRYQATNAPALPAKIIPFERKTPKRFFRLAFAFAVCAGFLMVSLGVWFQFSSGKVEVVKDSTETIALPVAKQFADETALMQPNDFVIKKVETPKQSAEHNFIKVRKSAAAVVRQNKTIVRNVEAKQPTAKLTREEKYAYDQLMLALSVTSSTFKMVKDKVEGVEEKNAVRHGGR